MDYRQHLSTLAASDPDLAAEVEPLRNLEHILGWLPWAGVAMAAVDLVQQDEYCYDFLVPLPGGPRWLVFGVT